MFKNLRANVRSARNHRPGTQFKFSQFIGIAIGKIGRVRHIHGNSDIRMHAVGRRNRTARSNFLLRPFMNEDVNIFYNKATKKVQREQRADHVRTLACVPTNYGAMMVAGRAFRTENAESNGTLTSVSYAAGLHCLAIDNDGKLLWVKNIRRSDMQKKGDDLIKVSLLSDGSNAYIVKSEHPKAPLDYAIAKEAKTLELGNKSNLIIYTLNPLGEVQKLLVEAKTKHSHLRAIRRSDGVFALYSANGNKVRQAQLKFTK